MKDKVIKSFYKKLLRILLKPIYGEMNEIRQTNSVKINVLRENLNEMEQKYTQWNLNNRIEAEELKNRELTEMLNLQNQRILEHTDTLKYFGDTLGEKSYLLQLNQDEIKKQKILIKKLFIQIKNIEVIDEKDNYSVIQIVPVLKEGDAIGNYAISLMNILSEHHIENSIYTYENDANLKDAQILGEIPIFKSKDILLLHMAAENEFSELIEAYNGLKVLIYHNITPDKYFEGYSDFERVSTKKGLMQTKYLADKVDYCIADSEYNKQELLKMGYTCPITVAPVPIDFTVFNEQVDEETYIKLDNTYNKILFVGRIAPNKKIEDILECFKQYRIKYDSNARLILAGSYDENSLYYKMLKEKIATENIENVWFTGHISISVLLAIYKNSCLFLCMSEHEGFCVPIVEAMYFKIPIIAYNAGAVANTMSDGGILITKKDFIQIADTMDDLLNQTELKQEIIKRQDKVMKKYNYSSAKDKLYSIINSFMEDEK